ncbi:hypothetical protein A3768_1405 [Ralstonia solanacearum]|nr:hypothetical protein F504_2108 [Ralstonia pseudosolanacearum FQY_4]ANH32565.1 hypothetical protein A3768_1405 [Ralstonia solanacearum]
MTRGGDAGATSRPASRPSATAIAFGLRDFVHPPGGPA